MTTIAELSIPASEFALDETFEKCQGLEVDVLQGVAHNSSGLSNLVWVATDDHECTHRALMADNTVSDITNLGEVDGRWLYRMDWNTPVTVAITVLLEDATMLGASGTDGSWSFRVLFPERSALSIAATLFEEYDIGLRIERIYELGGTGEHGEYDLTDEQREALQAALKAGYFKVPRDSTLGSIAEDLGISHQALSERLRRANEILTEAALGPVSANEQDVRPD